MPAMPATVSLVLFFLELALIFFAVGYAATALSYCVLQLRALAVALRIPSASRTKALAAVGLRWLMESLALCLRVALTAIVLFGIGAFAAVFLPGVIEWITSKLGERFIVAAAGPVTLAPLDNLAWLVGVPLVLAWSARLLGRGLPPMDTGTS